MSKPICDEQTVAQNHISLVRIGVDIGLYPKTSFSLCRVKSDGCTNSSHIIGISGAYGSHILFGHVFTFFLYYA